MNFYYEILKIPTFLLRIFWPLFLYFWDSEFVLIRAKIRKMSSKNQIRKILGFYNEFKKIQVFLLRKFWPQKIRKIHFLLRMHREPTVMSTQLIYAPSLLPSLLICSPVTPTAPIFKFGNCSRSLTSPLSPHLLPDHHLETVHAPSLEIAQGVLIFVIFNVPWWYS